MLTLTKPTVIEAQYRITTPMFLGNAFQQPDKEVFQAASFKGALRFWWRALNWSRCFADAAGDISRAAALLHQREASLFGLAADKQNSAQSRVQLQIGWSGIKLQGAGAPIPRELNPVSYLMGMGLAHFRDGLLRECVTAGELQVRVQLRPGKLQTLQQDERELSDALLALGVFGGLGSRARKGFGSLAIQSLESPNADASPFKSLDDIRKFLQRVSGTCPSAGVPLTAFTRDAKVVANPIARSPLEALGEVNHEMQMYRSFGRDGKVSGQAAERNFVPDHDLARDAAHGKRVSELPKRAVFGLPHNYHFSSGGDVEIAPAKDARRASPLFIHVHQFPGKNEAVVIQSLLPGMFLPRGTEIQFKPKGRGPHTVPFQNVDWKVIDTYLDRFDGELLLAPHKNS